MLLTRREAIARCGGGLAMLMGPPAFAQAAYPSRTIKMIVPFPAGGTTDLLGRLVADQLKTGLGATVIVTGLSPEIAQTLVTIGVDLGKMNTVGDLQGGIEQAERLLGYKVVPIPEPQ